MTTELDLKVSQPTVNYTPYRTQITTRKASVQEAFDKIPDGVFGYVSYPNDGWGMAIKGKMPQGMTREQVLSGCGVNEHGMPLFKQFREGVFLLTYNYD